ncbi:Nn.00g022950.m01.CDS01 [Neocucurbitaria sp. VM-36]
MTDIQNSGKQKTAPCSSHVARDFIIDIDTDSRATTVVNPVPISSPPEKTTENSHRKKAALTAAAGDINATITMPLEDYPRGYPILSAFQSSDSSFSIYRAFNYLHSRVLLEIQDELRNLEENLSELDRKDNNSGRSKCLTSRASDIKQAKRDNKHSERATLLATIRDKLVNYDEILVKARELNTFQKPSKRDYTSLRTWFFNEKPLSYECEEEYVKKKEDLISLRDGREWANFDGWIEECIKAMPRYLTRRLFTTPELRKKTQDKHIFYCSASRIEKLVGLVLTLIIFILLVLPVVALYKMTSVGHHNSTFDAVGILVVFTLLFSAVMSLLTKAKRHELFAASAAYCAVLVVFISNFNK